MDADHCGRVGSRRTIADREGDVVGIEMVEDAIHLLSLDGNRADYEKYGQ